jgi:hypothetical protein
VLKKREKALVIYGPAHFYLAAPPDYVASMGGQVRGSTLSLGQIADACVYVGRNADFGSQGRPARFE